MIKDADGNELSYWPISGLIEGEDSETLVFYVQGGGTLYATESDKCIFWARRVGDPTWVNVAVSPYSLVGLTGDIAFEGYVEALTPIVGLERIPLTVVAGSSGPAGWEI